jgi:glycosyltransferase involved in cell wall biosynthesis
MVASPSPSARLVFLNRFYWPDEPATAQLLTDLAESLAEKGRPVTVITSNPDPGPVPRDERRHGVQITRIASSRAKHPGVVGKTVDFATFHVGALWRLFRLCRRDDVIVAMTDPPLLGVGVGLIATLRGARLVHWVQDIYPEIAIELAGHAWLRIFRPLRNRAWRAAQHCVTVGHDMGRVLAAAGVAESRRSVIPNWAPAGLAPPPPGPTEALRAAWNLTGKFVVAYSGNLGRVHDLDPVIALAALLRDDAAIAFLFVGAGAQRAALESTVRAQRLPNVHFHPPQPRNALAASLAVGDVHLVTLRPGCESYVFPSKLYGVAAVGRPVIVIAPSQTELGRLVVDHGLGRAFDRTALAALAAEIRLLAGDPAECARRGSAALRFAHTHRAAVGAECWAAVLDAARAC